MKTFIYAAALAALAANVLASPVATGSMFMPITILPFSTATTASSVAAATCTSDIFVDPVGNGPECTIYAATTTITSELDCGGCALSTRHLGFGVPCQKSTSVQETKTVTETACATPAGIIVPPFQPAPAPTTTSSS